MAHYVSGASKKILYLPLSKQEQRLSWPIAIVFLGGVLLLGARQLLMACLLALLTAVVLAIVCRAFWRETFSNIPLFGWKLLLRPILATVLHLVFCTFIYDILMFMRVQYFVYTDWGPLLWNVRADMLQRHPQFALLAVMTVLVLPMVEELIFRQLIFSTVHPKSPTLAVILSVALFTAFHTLPYLGMVDTLYWWIYAFQFIPMGLFLCWMYCSTDSLLAPILMHMLLNAITVRNAVTYMTMFQ